MTTGPPEELGLLEAKALADLAPTECTVSTLSVLEQQPDGRWRTARELPLTT